MDCKRGGFVSIRHNKILEAAMLTGDHYRYRTANTTDDAREDVKARGLWRKGQTAFFYVRVTHVNAQSNRNLSTDQTLKNAEQGQKRACNDRIIQMENRTFTPLIFGTNGAMGYECDKFHKELALKLKTRSAECRNAGV